VAIAATYSFALTVDQLIRRSMQVAGLLSSAHTPEDEDLSLARDLLAMELDAQQTEGVSQRNIERDTKTLVSGTAEYTLDDDTVDVIVGPGNIAGTIIPSSGSETHVRAISRHEYQSITNKDADGTPSLVFVEKASSVKAVFWPVPDATATFRYSKLRLPRDSSGSSNTDVDRRRQKAMVWALAHDLAVSKGLSESRVKMLRDERDRLKAYARVNDMEQVHAQFYVSRGR